MAGSYTRKYGPDSVGKLAGDGTHEYCCEATLLSANPLTIASRIQTIETVQYSIKTNAGGASGITWAAGSNDGEIDMQAAGSDGNVVVGVLVKGKGTC